MFSNSYDALFIQGDCHLKCDTCKRKVKKPSKRERGEGECNKCILRHDRFIQKEDTMWDRIVQAWHDNI